MWPNTALITFNDCKLMLKVTHVAPRILQFPFQVFHLSLLSLVQNLQLSELLAISGA